MRKERSPIRVVCFGDSLTEGNSSAVEATPVLLSPHYPAPDRRADGLRKYDQGNGSTYADNFRPYHLGIRRVAQKCIIPLIDLPKLMVRERVKTVDLLTEDGVHLTPEGNRFYAEQVRRQVSAIVSERPALRRVNCRDDYACAKEG